MKWIHLHMLIAVAAFAAVFARADEYDSLRGRWRDMLTFGTNAVSSDPLYAPWLSTLAANATSYLNTMSNGPTRTYLWKTYSSLSNNSSDISGTYGRLRMMALAFSVHGSALKGDTNIRNAITNGLDWMNANYYNATGALYDNWFDFNIATPLVLNDIVTLLYSNLSPTQITAYMDAVDHFTPVPDLTAANKVWKSMVVALRGVLVKDSAKIQSARLALSDVFPSVTTGDGFYADGSFIFHGEFPYNGGYGVEMLDTIGSLIQLLQGSTWQVSDPAQVNVYRWVYDGYEPFIYKGALMPMVDGRYHTRTGNDHAAGHDLLGAVLRIAQSAPTNDAAAYKAFVKSAILSDTVRPFVQNQLPPYNVWANAVLNASNLPAIPDTLQHRQFPGMDRVVHRTPSWTLGLAMSSSRVANYESTRGENLRGWFTAEGMTYLHNADLLQYTDNFWQTIDPYRLPGTTVDTVVRTNGSGDSYRPTTPLPVGGASILDQYGVVAMHLNSWNSTLSARKGWFMFDNEIVCLGNSVSSTDGRGAETIVENRRLNTYGDNDFTVNGTAKPTNPGWSENISGISWAHLAGSVPGSDIGYYFPGSTSVKVLRESRAGSLYDLNTTYGTTNRSTRHYLTMWFDHGTNPTGGTYAYVLLPNKSAAEMAAYAAAPEITVVANNSNVQTVRKPKLGLTAVNFWRDQTNSTAGITCDRRACVILRNDGSLLDIGISDPVQTNTGFINIELTNSATTVLSADAGISVLQISPTIKLAVSVSNRLGMTLRAQFALVPAQTNFFSPVADTYVQNGPQAITNFGLATTLAVKTNATLGQTREAYLKFDLSSLSGTILSANLRLVPTSATDALYHAIAPVPDNMWTETGVVWTNKPNSLAEYARWIVPLDGSAVTVPLTSLAQQSFAADGKLSLRVYSTGTPTPTNNGFTAYGSQQNSLSSNRPLLSVTTLRLPPTISLSITGETVLNAPGSVTLNATASDADGAISSVEFYNGSTRIAQVLQAPYGTVLQNLSAGTYALTAVATDNSGISTTSQPVVINVYNAQPVGRGSGLNGDYFSDRNLSTLALSRVDTNVNFTWGSLASPAPQVPPDFSARWTGRVQARRAGNHYFHAITDEGVRLWVDGKLLIDNWSAHLQTEDTGSITLIPGRYYDLVMEFYDGSASATAQLLWTQPGVAKEVIPMSQLYPADQGLRGVYFSGTNFATPVLTRIDEGIHFVWGTNSPDPTLLPGAFSVRWTGKLRAPQSGTYSFFATSDDAIKVSINGQCIISNWVAHSSTEDSNSIPFAAGNYYDLIVEYFNATGAATAVLMWQPPGDVKQLIPAANLTLHRNNTAPVLNPVSTLLAARGSPVTTTITAVDNDAPAQPLSFLLDPGAPPGASVLSSNGVFSWTPSNAQAPGPYNVTVRVNDGGSPEMTDAQSFTIIVLTNMTSSIVTLIPTGGSWRYQDNGADLGTSWRNLNYSEPSWKSGTAKLGYGFGDENTVVSYGSNAGSKSTTTYFRSSFILPDVSLLQSLTARMARDDGAVIYVNGTEVWRDNMPGSAVSYSTLASTELTGSDQTQYVSRVLSPTAFANGTNVIAVELHQASAATPDAAFDLELKAQAFVPTDVALVTSRSGNVTTLTWPFSAGLLRPVVTTNLTTPVVWQRVTNSSNLSNGLWTVILPNSTNANTFYRLQTP